MKKKLSKGFALLLTFAMVLMLPGTVWAADSDRPTISNNIYNQNYITRPSSTVNSYLFENENGGLTRVEYIPGAYKWVYSNGKWIQEESSSAWILAENYSSNFVFQRSWSIPMELDIWGGFFAGENFNFLVFGQINSEEDDSKEVIRVVKYSKDWKRLGQASLYGANTTIPFRAGSLRMTEYGGELYIRTSHQMYKSNEGVNHQANLTLAIHESDMMVTDSADKVNNYGSNYVSHSFNQFILIDQEKRIVALDHGDAYPRSAEMTVFAAKAGTTNITKGKSKYVTIQNFPGEIGDNTTGASLGGLAETSSGYVVVYNYDGKGNTNTVANRRVYFAYVDKNSPKEGIYYVDQSSGVSGYFNGATADTKIISSPGAMTPVLAPTSLEGGYILWNSSHVFGFGDDELHFATYSDGGRVGEVKTATAPLSDCQPIYYNGKVVWYVTDNTRPIFYTLDDSGVSKFLVDARDQFTDLANDAFYLEPVAWAVNEGITSGTGDGTTFSPNDPCSRSQIVTFLWNAAGKPEPTSTTNPFIDVKSTDWFYKAVLWAVEQGVTSGTSATTFSPNKTCTRAEAVTFQWNATKRPSTSTTSSFSDVKTGAWYYDAVNWAVKNDITAGTGGNKFSPDAICTRAQIVSFLYRERAKF